MPSTTEVISAQQLIDYPGSGSPTPKNAATYARLVNGLVNEVWAEPIEPVPFWVHALALEVGARASRNPKGLQSWTRSLDDGQRTERISEDAAKHVGVYLTDDERNRLLGKPAARRRRRFGTIRVTPGV